MSAERADFLHAGDLAIILRCAGARCRQCRRHGARDRGGRAADGGAMVTFTVCPFTADYPEQPTSRSSAAVTPLRYLRASDACATSAVEGEAE